jgi:hypothetical protein
VNTPRVAARKSGLSIDDLVDRAEIIDVLVTYCTALRTQDLDLFDEVFAADAVIDYTETGGSRAGLEATKAWLSELLAGVRSFELFVGDSEFHIAHDRRSASVRTTWHGLFVPRSEGAALQVYGHYQDQLVRGDRWVIAERVDHPTARVVASLDAGDGLPS